MSLETLNVKGPSKYGLQTVEGVYYSISKKAGEKGLKPEAFSAGMTVVADIYTATSGKKYINEVKSSNVAAVVGAAPVVASSAAKSDKPMVYGRQASDYELVKDVRIGVAGLEQAIISNPGLISNPDPEVFGETLEALLRKALEINQKLVAEKSGK